MDSPSPEKSREAERAVQESLAYFASVGQTVEKKDVWRWLYRPSRFVTKEEVLLELEGRREEVWKGEGEVNEAVERKYKVARWFSKYLACIPGVRGVAVCNTLAWEVAREDSDIDLFIITKPMVIWLVRLLSALPLLLFKKRPGDKTSDPICLSYFITEEALNLAPLQIQPEDPYLAYWTRSVVPIVDDGVFKEFSDANGWAKEKLPNAQLSEKASGRCIDVSCAMRWNNVAYRSLRATRVLCALERISRVVQIWMFPQTIRTKMNLSSDVVVNDRMLKFHVKDARRDIYEQWKRLCKES